MLPIVEFFPQISEQLACHSNVVLEAEPGAGKSTALPLMLLKANILNGLKIVMLEPRRVAAKSIAHYLAKQLDEVVGETVGYQVKNDRKTSKNTVLEIVTEGILARRIQADPELPGIGLIIFDEFHERTINADFTLMLALEIQQSIRDDLKILVMSATIDTKAIAAYLHTEAIISCPGRNFPVSVKYIENKNSPLITQVINAISAWFDNTNTGDVLVFLPGQSDINKAISEAKIFFYNNEITTSQIELLPLYGSLPIQQQELALSPVNGEINSRRIIFSTNIAETSLTIDGITCVIDSGLEKILVYEASSDMTRLVTAPISKASAAQRKGRAGRVQAGHCIRLWSEAKQNSLKPYQGEEILSADLSHLVLNLFLWGEKDYETINWLTSPPRAHFDSALNTLSFLGLISSTVSPNQSLNYVVTELGKQAATIGVTPRLAAMILSAENKLEASLACEIAALISDGDIFSQRQGVDIVNRLIALQDYKKNKKSAIENYPINRFSAEQALINAKNFMRCTRTGKSSTNSGLLSLADMQKLTSKLLLLAYPDRLAKCRADNSNRYQLANGKGVMLHENEALIGSKWLIVNDCNALNKEGLIYSCCKVDESFLSELINDKLSTVSDYMLDAKKTKIIAREIKKYHSIIIGSQSLNYIPPDEFIKCIKKLITSEGLGVFNWSPKCEAWLTRVDWLGRYLDSFPEINHEYLINHADDWLLPYITNVSSLSALKKVNLLDLMKGLLTWNEQVVLDKEAPIRYTAPSGIKVNITYGTSQGPTVSVVLQEMFGELKTPMIAQQRVALRFELLSPARRAIQTTSDLGNFWTTSYIEVAKDMRGKYPKHRWPEEPLLEKAGKSYKPRSR